MPFRVLTIAVTLIAAQAALVAVLAALRRGNIYVTVLFVAVATSPIVWFGDAWIAGRTLSTDGRMFLVLLNLALGGLVFHFMTLPDRSVTLRVLVELERAPARTLTIRALAERYSVRDMIVSRLRQMADGGFITIGADGRITIEPRGATFGRFVTGGRRLFGITSAN
jgi:hypothetical protein